MIAINRDALRSYLKRGWPMVLVLGIGFAIGGFAFHRSPGSSAPHAKHAAAPQVETKSTIWTCSMHPQIRQPEPGQCPICGMDLIPVSQGNDTQSDRDGSVVLSERAKALAKLRTATVRRRSDGAADVRLLGRVEPNEKTLKTVTAWTGGRIDRLFVRVTGEHVRAGQVIATLYSPEVFAAHQDLLVAKRQLERMSAAVPTGQQAATAALEASRERLRLLGVPDDEVTFLESLDKPTRAISIRSPFGGTVIERLANEGSYVTTGAPLFRVANLDSLWIQLDAYESDLSRLAIDQQVSVEIEAFPGEQFEGRVTFIDPTLDPKRRTARVRVEAKNRDGRLRPGMFAQAIVAAPTEQGADAPLVIPSTAPLFTGRRSIVYVEVTSGDSTAYEPRTVRLGPRLGSFYPIVAGLSEGERVVTRGAFALDADLQIHGGASMMTSPDDSEPGSWDEAIDIPREALRRLAPVVAAYLSVQRGLAADDLTRAQAAAVELGQLLGRAKIDNPAEAKQAWAAISQSLSGHGRHVAQANSIEHARTGFEGLSSGIAMLLRQLGNPLDQALVLAFCPMAFGSRGASWVQQGTDIDNSYFGESMRTCGEIKQSVEPGAHLSAQPDPKPPAPKAAPAGGHQH